METPALPATLSAVCAGRAGAEVSFLIYSSLENPDLFFSALTFSFLRSKILLESSVVWDASGVELGAKASVARARNFPFLYSSLEKPGLSAPA